MTLVYRWAQTPKELFDCFAPVNSQEVRVVLPTTPFKLPKRPLAGTPYLYQLGMSDTSVAQDAILMHKECPSIPLTGDRRTGILVYHGNLLIAAHIIPGNLNREPRQIIVREGYRKQGLGSRMVEQWYREVPGVLDVPKQPISIMAAKTFLKAHEMVVRWAITNGKDVSQKVKDAIANGKEKAEILAKLNLVENSSPRPRLGFRR
jgi:hypothetical protein